MPSNFMSISILVAYVCLCSFVVLGNKQYYAHTKLIDDLLANYDKNNPPTPKPGIPVNVSLGLAIAQIVSVEEKIEGVNLNVWNRMKWNDYRLSWDPKMYNNITDIMLDSDIFWMPDITNYKPLSADGTKTIGMKQNDEDLSWKIALHYDGSTIFNFPGMIYGQCALNIADYPFDQHNCSFVFASWVHDESEINLSLRESNSIDFSNYVSNNEWSVTSYGSQPFDLKYSCCPNAYKMLYFNISIQRGASSYVSNYIIPSIIIIILSIMMFTLPPEVGKRMEIGINLLLCLSVYLTILNTKMPTRSDVFPLLSKFYGCCIFILTFALLCTCWVVTYYFHDMSGWKIYVMSKFVQIVLLHYLKRILLFPSENKVRPVKKDGAGTKTIQVKPMDEEDLKPKKRKNVEKKSDKNNNKEEKDLNEMTNHLREKKRTSSEKGNEGKKRERSRSRDANNEKKEKRKRESIPLNEIKEKKKEKKSKEGKRRSSVESTASKSSNKTTSTLDKKEKKSNRPKKIDEELGLTNKGIDAKDSVREAPSLKNKTEQTDCSNDKEASLFDKKTTPDHEFDKERNNAAAQEGVQLLIHLADYFSDNSQRKKNRYQWRQAAIVLNRLFTILLILSIVMIIIAVFLAR